MAIGRNIECASSTYRASSVKRRPFLRYAIGVAVLARAMPLGAQTTATGARRVGVLAPSTRAKEEVTLKPFFDEMGRLGWIEGRTIVYDRIYANDRHQDLPKLARDGIKTRAGTIAANPAFFVPMPEEAANNPLSPPRHGNRPHFP